MEENEEKQERELKKEATDTLNETKEQIKNINIKEEAQKGKGLVGKLLKDSTGTIKEIVKDEKNQFYKTAILVVCIWIVIVLLKEILSCIVYEFHTFKILRTIKIIIAPILKIIAMSIIIHMLNKENKQAVAIAKIPVVISSCLGFLTYISSNITYITNPISSLLSIISTILMFFVVKEMFEEENEKALKTFIKVEAIYYIVVFAFSFLGISL